MHAVRVENLTKEYRLGEFASLSKIVRSVLNKFVKKSHSTETRFKALDNITFDIEKGEIVGIISGRICDSIIWSYIAY